MSPTSSRSTGATRERLIESHLPLVRASARRHAPGGEEFDDLVQVGAIALIRAADRFDPNRGVAFSTFAAPAIEGAIRRHLRDRGSPLRVPRELQRRSGELRRRRSELTAALGRPPTVGELATALDSTEGEVERLLAAERASDPVVSSSGEDRPELSGGEEPLAGSDDRLLLAQSVRVLNEREQRIVFLRFHADMTERQIGRELGISQAHVSRLLDGALAKLRKELSDDEQAPESAPARTRIAGVASSPSDEGARPKSPSHSGRFLVRMPSALHRQLAEAAERENVSLNRFVTDVLASSVGEQPRAEPSPPSKPAAAGPVRRPGRAFRVALATNLAVVVLVGAIAVTLLVLALERGV